jgi:hypothetical protein
VQGDFEKILQKKTEEGSPRFWPAHTQVRTSLNSALRREAGGKNGRDVLVPVRLPRAVVAALPEYVAAATLN